MTFCRCVSQQTALESSLTSAPVTGHSSGTVPTMQRCFDIATSLLALPDDVVLRGVLGTLANLCVHSDGAGTSKQRRVVMCAQEELAGQHTRVVWMCADLCV